MITKKFKLRLEENYLKRLPKKLDQEYNNILKEVGVNTIWI